jgi:hypothetical protein
MYTSRARMMLYVGYYLRAATIYSVFQVTYHWFAGILAALAAFGIIGGYTTYKLMVKR